MLQASGAVDCQHRETWLLQATWDGVVAASAAFSPDALMNLSLIERVVVPGWREAVAMVSELGGYGPVQLSLVCQVRKAVDNEGEREGHALPPRGSWVDRLPETTWIRRQVQVAGPSEDQIGSIHRELQRAAGQASFENPPT